MSWGSFDDNFHRWPIWRGVSYEARWVYIALALECNSKRQWDGILPREEAMCATPGCLTGRAGSLNWPPSGV